MNMKAKMKNFMRFTCDYITTVREKLPFNVFRVTVNNRTELRNLGKKTVCQKLSKENT